MGSTRRTILAAGAAAAVTAAVPRVFAQQPGKGGTGKFYERGSVRIYYEEAGSGFPLLLLPGGGLNATPRSAFRWRCARFIRSCAGLGPRRLCRECCAAAPPAESDLLPRIHCLLWQRLRNVLI